MNRILCAALTLLLPTSVPMPASRTGEPALQGFVGCYELAGNHPVVVSARPGPGGAPLLLFSDLKTDAVRALAPDGGDTFHFGPELTRPEPSEGTLRFERDATGAVRALALERAGRAKVSGPRLPIETFDVTFERDGLELEGTFYLPPDLGSTSDERPGLLFAHGSEDEGQRGHFDALPWVAARLGFVAFAYDKRGTGASEGSWHVGLEVLAGDGAAALALLREHERVDPDRIGILGTSEGGWTAPLIARLDGRVAFLVALYGGGMTKGDTFLHKHALRFREAGLEGARLEEAMAEKRAIVRTSAERVAAGTATGFDLRITYDPAEDWKRFDGAVLALMGDADVLQDTPRCADWLRGVLAGSRSSDWEVKVFPRTHHGMFLATDGGTQEFQRMRVSQVVPGYWPTLIRWLEGRFEGGSR